MVQPTYKFKYLDLKDYMENRRCVARRMRRDAEILVKEAETIEMEMQELQVSLLVVKEEG